MHVLSCCSLHSLKSEAVHIVGGIASLWSLTCFLASCFSLVWFGLVLSLPVGTVACFGVVSQQQQEIETGKQNASHHRG
jgi:hypothetical protein